LVEEDMSELVPRRPVDHLVVALERALHGGGAVQRIVVERVAPWIGGPDVADEHPWKRRVRVLAVPVLDVHPATDEQLEVVARRSVAPLDDRTCAQPPPTPRIRIRAPHADEPSRLEAGSR
jgi:hypothetical protein